MHPEEYDDEIGESLTWARLPGTAGHRLHIFNPAKGYDTLYAYCNVLLSPSELRDAPDRDVLPNAKACPMCIRAHQKIPHHPL